MLLTDILQDIYTLEDEMRDYERKYGVLSETFYESYMAGEEPPNDGWMLDWTAWASAYKVWLRRHEQYRAAVHALRIKAPDYASVIERTARRESIRVPA